MNKTAIKNFAIWARNKLIADISYKAGLLGISEKGINSPLPQSTKDVQFFDIGTKEPYSISEIEIKQREALVTVIRNKEQQSDYSTTYKTVVEEVAYTWFNRLIAVRFMEVNDYLPSHIRVLSAEGVGKDEPDLVTNPFETDLEFTPYEKDRIIQLKQENRLDELFRMLFIKQCNALNAILPNLFEKTSDYTELLLNIAFTDQDGVVYHLVHDIPEDDFNVSKEGQVEIIGWLYQYYNTEPKDETFVLLKQNVKITKERIPAATQLFTPDWIVRYMVENSLGRIFVEWSLKGLELSEQERLEKEEALAEKMGWKYYLPEAEQEPEVRKQLNSQLLTLYTDFRIENLKVIDPCMGSGHILVYAFDVLMQIYESYGYSQRDAAKSIIENNLYGLDIDNRAYQLAYFAVMMKARQYNRRILNRETNPHVYAIQESNGINRDQLEYFGAGMDELQRNIAVLQIQGLLDTFIDAKEYGSILNVDSYDWELLYIFVDSFGMTGQLSFDTVGIEDDQLQLRSLVKIGAIMSRKYDVVVTNPPYMGGKGINSNLSSYIQQHYPKGKNDIFAAFLVKCMKWAKPSGLLAFITPYVWLYLSSYEELRYSIITNSNLMSLVQLEYNSFEAACVPVCMFIIRNSLLDYKGRYIQLAQFTGWENQETKTLDAIKDFTLSYCYETHQSNFLKISGSPIAYWLSESIYNVFESAKPLKDFGYPRQGMSTADNESFIRRWYEVCVNNIDFSCIGNEYTHKKWYPHSKGGSLRRWYGNNEFVVNWKNNGSEIKKFNKAVVRNSDYYFRPGITWSDVTISWFTARYVPAGFTFNCVGPTFFPHNNVNLKYICGYFNSLIFQEFLNISCQGMHYGNGIIAELPVIICDDEQSRRKIEYLVDECIEISKWDWDEDETSWDFQKDILANLATKTKLLSNSILDYTIEKEKMIQKLTTNEKKINDLFFSIFKMNEITPAKGICLPTIQIKNDKSLIINFISYFVGCMFGRYSLNAEGLAYAGGQWDDGKYSTFIPDKDNILPITDEEYFEDDIVGLFVDFVKKVYGSETLEENLGFITKALGNKGNTSREIIRNYFLKDFFKDHCKVYQKRPIYWLFDSGKADGFKALIYMHRYDENTIGNLRIDYLHKMQRVYEREIARMQETIDQSTNAREVAAAEKRKEKLTKQLKETKDYDEKIAHLALSRIAIDLDDGVKVNYEKVQIGTDGKKLEVLAKI